MKGEKGRKGRKEGDMDMQRKRERGEMEQGEKGR